MYSLKYLYTYFQISLVYIQARGYVTTLECGDTTSLFYNKNGKVLCSSLSPSVVSDCFNMKWQSIEIAEKYSARVLSSSVVSDCFNMKWQSLEVAEKYSARVLSSSVVGDCFNMKWQSIEIAEKYSARVLSSSVVSDCFNMKWQSLEVALQGRIQDFKLWGGALKKIAPSGGRRENFWGISCEKSRFYAKKSYFFQF